MKNIFLAPSPHPVPNGRTSLRAARNVMMAKWVGWLLFLSWWWVPTVLVVGFFYATIKYGTPIIVWLFNYIVDTVREVRNGH